MTLLRFDVIIFMQCKVYYVTSYLEYIDDM